MMRAPFVAGRGTRPGLAASEAGLVTVEALAALIPLFSFFLLLLSLLGGVTMEMGITSASRDAARVAALQPDLRSATQAAVRVVGSRGHVSIHVAGEFVDVTVTRQLHIPGIPKALLLGSTSSAFRESPW